MMLVTLLGIVAPALLLTLAVRRWVARVDWRIAAICLALAVGFVARGVFTSGVPVPLDEVVRGWPYRGIFGEPVVKNYLTNDTVKQILPWMAAVREEFAHGRAPLWDRYLFCGYPLLGNGQSAPFSPFFLATLFVPLPKQLVAMAGLKLFVALLFGYLLIRREGAGDVAALFGSVVFAFAIFNNCFLYYPMTSVTLLLPAAAYAVLTRSFGLTAIVVASLLAGGHPESVVHVALAVLVLVAIERTFTLREFWRVTAGALTGLLIAAPAWAPTLETALTSNRVAWLKTIPLGTPFPATALWAMVAPDGFGNPAHHNWNWVGEYTQIASLYVGLIALVFFPTALFSRRATTRDRLLALVTILFFLVSMHWSPLARLFYAVPPLSWVGHDRLRFVVAFFVGIIAARAVTRLRRDDVVIAVAGAAVAIGCFLHAFAKLHGKTLDNRAVAGVVLLALFLLTLTRRRVVPVAAFVLTAIDLFLVTFDYNAITPREWYAPRLPIIEALRRAAPAEPFRVVGRDWVFLPNAAAQYGLEDVRGSDPMEWGEYRQLFPPEDPFQASVGLRLFPDPNEPILDALNVRFLMAEPGIEVAEKWRRIYSGPDGNLFENTSWLPRFYSAGSPQTRIATWMTRPTRFRLRIDAPARTLVASSQPAMRWWRVLINGKRAEIVRTNGVFIGFFAPAGRSEVVVEYHSLTWLGSLLAAALGGLILIGASRGIRPGGGSLSGVPARDLIVE